MVNLEDLKKTLTSTIPNNETRTSFSSSSFVARFTGLNIELRRREERRLFDFTDDFSPLNVDDTVVSSIGLCAGSFGNGAHANSSL